MIVVHYRCDRCGKDGHGREGVLPRGWSANKEGPWRTIGGSPSGVTVTVRYFEHWCSEECSLPPRYPHVPWSMQAGGDRFLGRHEHRDLYFTRLPSGEPRIVARNGPAAGDTAHGWGSIALGLCEGEKRARALGLVEDGR